jgi:chaperonin cofactor prefoldin
MSSVQQRTLLYARLEEVLGAEPAGILMQELAPQDNAATKSDLAELRVQLESRIDAAETRLNTRMDGLDTRMDGLDTRMDGLDSRMERLENHMDRFDGRLHDFHGALREQTRHFILASTGAMVALTGVAFGAAALI